MNVRCLTVAACCLAINCVIAADEPRALNAAVQQPSRASA
jgi:hypothetical protein